MVALCIPPVFKWHNFCNYGALDLCFLQDIPDFNCLCLLLAVMIKDGTPASEEVVSLLSLCSESLSNNNSKMKRIGS